jgi:UDP-N-acetylglucosamine 2-epimerase (non-hydrolysing)
VAITTLRHSGVGDEPICFVGNAVIDSLLANIEQLQPPSFWRPLGLEPQGYFVLTLYRRSNVDDTGRLSALLCAIDDVSRGLPVLFPVHPRTAISLASLGGRPLELHLVEHQSHLEFNWLVKYARAVITDSGWVTEQTTAVDEPCMTLLDTNERPESVTLGTNMLTGTDPAACGPAFELSFARRWQSGGLPPLWGGKSADKIVAALQKLLPIRGVSG